MSKSLPIAVLISGSGRSLKNLIDRIAAERLDAEIRLVISSSESAGGLAFARDAGIPTQVTARRDSRSLEEFSEANFAAIRDSGAELVVMAGYLKLLPIPDDFANRVINIHPGLIPAFCGNGMFGHHVHQAVIDYGAKVSGCTVHFVDNQYDHGPVIMQRTVEVLDDDTADTLAARVFEAELEALPAVVQHLASGEVQVVGRRVRVVTN